MIPFPFTDLTATKLRPALIIFEGEKDVVAAFISSRIQKQNPPSITIDKTHPEFALTGLKLPSVIKLDKVATVSKELILGEIGHIGPDIKAEINRKIMEVYGFTD